MSSQWGSKAVELGCLPHHFADHGNWRPFATNTGKPGCAVRCAWTWRSLDDCCAARVAASGAWRDRFVRDWVGPCLAQFALGEAALRPIQAQAAQSRQNSRLVDAETVTTACKIAFASLAQELTFAQTVRIAALIAGLSGGAAYFV
jgi:hypothetical protein